MNKKNTIIFSVALIVGLSTGAALFFDYWKENRAVTIDENYCNQYQPDSCPNGCVVCPPCPECSSIQCRLASSCEAMGFDKDWYRQTKPSSGEPAGIANPASVYCQEQGGRLEIREDSNGGQYGVCIFSDGQECEEWAFYRGECGKDDKQNDCVKQGGYCAQECNENDGVVYLKGCPSGQVCCMSDDESFQPCKDLCGNGICQEVVCLAIGCPCAETAESCPQDCK